VEGFVRELILDQGSAKAPLPCPFFENSIDTRVVMGQMVTPIPAKKAVASRIVSESRYDLGHFLAKQPQLYTHK